MTRKKTRKKKKRRKRRTNEMSRLMIDASKIMVETSVAVAVVGMTTDVLKTLKKGA